ncbi:unnamed protein product [Schistosoma margrebowiei]|uniref:Uncharacterized protein n=1 Tax=Schistosoma margrebowiei TaxID=48269 RepID=A0A3P7YB20_9TREM|nr:unnamed protein product [Schistosoma margrebowiei]
MSSTSKWCILKEYLLASGSLTGRKNATSMSYVFRLVFDRFAASDFTKVRLKTFD